MLKEQWLSLIHSCCIDDSKRATKQALSMVQSSRSRALLAVFLVYLAVFNRCMCIPGGAGTATTSKVCDRHRSHLPDHSNAPCNSLASISPVAPEALFQLCALQSLVDAACALDRCMPTCV